MNCTRTIWKKHWIHSILHILVVQNSLHGKEFNKFCPSNSRDDLCLFFCIFPSSLALTFSSWSPGSNIGPQISSQYIWTCIYVNTGHRTQDIITGPHAGTEVSIPRRHVRRGSYLRHHILCVLCAGGSWWPWPGSSWPTSSSSSRWAGPDEEHSLQVLTKKKKAKQNKQWHVPLKQFATLFNYSLTNHLIFEGVCICIRQLLYEGSHNMSV